MRFYHAWCIAWIDISGKVDMSNKRGAPIMVNAGSAAETLTRPMQEA